MSDNQFLTCEVRTIDGRSLAVLVAAPKDFASGSRGFFGTAKIEIGGKRHQAQIQLIEIGSKARAAEAADE